MKKSPTAALVLRETAKNGLTVGACENARQSVSMTYGDLSRKAFPNYPFREERMTSSFNDIAAFSGRGPCSGGRIKPDVVAPGTFVLATKSSRMDERWGRYRPFARAENDYTFMSGTSFAVALVAGCSPVAPANTCGTMKTFPILPPP